MPSKRGVRFNRFADGPRVDAISSVRAHAPNLRERRAREAIAKGSIAVLLLPDAQDAPAHRDRTRLAVNVVRIQPKGIPQVGLDPGGNFVGAMHGRTLDGECRLL